ncbi:unnamed protein product [Durusdinium trenchii]|uniref:Uncharacterized protein n=1 Tax=Durusdinium trenchii TaxID=1381693 RepID=A0ABP0IH60_9DINO
MEKHDKAVQDCQRAVKLDPPTLEEPLLGWRHACACDPVPAPMSEWEIESFEAKQKAEAQAKASKEAAEKYARKAKAAAAKKSQEEAMRANLKKSRKKA